MGDARRIGLIGAGSIARSVVAEMALHRVGGWEVCAVLARRPGPREGLPVAVVDRIDDLLAARPDLIIDLAGPGALRQHGEAALAAADVWSISGMGLREPAFVRSLEAIGRASGHRLRLLPGAIGGLDAVSIIALDPQARVAMDARPEEPRSGPPSFEGTAAEAVARFHDMNILAAVSFAGIGLERTRIAYGAQTGGNCRLFSVHAESGYGDVTIHCRPQAGPRTIAGSVIAALRRQGQTIWVG